jgi:hypothetical protein
LQDRFRAKNRSNLAALHTETPVTQPVPVLFLLPALPVGGAEHQIQALVGALDRARFRPIVAYQHALGPVAAEIEGGGTVVHLLSDGRRLDLAFPARLVGLLRRERVKILVSHGFSTGVAGRLAAAIAGTPVRVLAEHSTGERDMSPTRHRVNRLLAPFTSAWVSVAHGQREYLLRVKGVPETRLHVIPNGIDAAPFLGAVGQRSAAVSLRRSGRRHSRGAAPGRITRRSFRGASPPSTSCRPHSS